jgi:hypothetical protein
MNRNDLAAEIARLEAATPSRVASFNEARAARLADLRAKLATMPTEPAKDDPAYLAMLEAADAASAKNRARARWC